MIEVPNLKVLNSLPSKPKNGEFAHCYCENKMYQYKGEWLEYEYNTPKEIDTGMSLYEANKQIIKQLPDISFEDRMIAREELSDVIDTLNQKHYLLLGADLNYYTMFEIDPKSNESILNAFFECIDGFDGVKAIEIPKGKDLAEVWVMSQDEAHVMYFFGYDAGVIKCR